jgi:hypothetical protein
MAKLRVAVWVAGIITSDGTGLYAELSVDCGARWLSREDLIELREPLTANKSVDKFPQAYARLVGALFFPARGDIPDGQLT